MDNLIPIRPDVVSPAMVAREVLKDLSTLEELHVVGIDHNGTPFVWSAGTLAGRALAILCMQEDALAALKPDPLPPGPNKR